LLGARSNIFNKMEKNNEKFQLHQQFEQTGKNVLKE
jgi:hypothetical protein